MITQPPGSIWTHEDVSRPSSLGGDTPICLVVSSTLSGRCRQRLLPCQYVAQVVGRVIHVSKGVPVRSSPRDAPLFTRGVRS